MFLLHLRQSLFVFSVSELFAMQHMKAPASVTSVLALENTDMVTGEQPRCAETEVVVRIRNLEISEDDVNPVVCATTIDEFT